MGFLDALKGGGGDAIRQSASLTMAYLLEQNRKFEAYMRGKVEELEARVAAQQARLAVMEGEAAEESDVPPAPLADEASPLPPEATAPGGDDLFAEEGAAFEMEIEEEAGPLSWQAMLVGAPPAAGEAGAPPEPAADPGEAEEAAAPAEGEAALENEEPAEEADVREPQSNDEISSLLPDWSAAGMSGVEALPEDEEAAEDAEETDSLLPDWSTAGGEATLESEEPAEDVDETDSLPPDWSLTEGETAPEGEEAVEDVEDDGAWESPLNAGQVEEWA